MKDEGTDIQGAAALPFPAEEVQRTLHSSSEPRQGSPLDQPGFFFLGHWRERSSALYPLPLFLPSLPSVNNYCLFAVYWALGIEQ